MPTCTCSASWIGPGALLMISLGRSGPSSSVGLAGRLARSAGVGSGIGAAVARAGAGTANSRPKASAAAARLLRPARDRDRDAIFARLLQLHLAGGLAGLEVHLGVVGVLLRLGHGERGFGQIGLVAGVRFGQRVGGVP